MTDQDLVNKIREAGQVLQSLTQLLNVYEGMIPAKKNQLDLLDKRLAELGDAHKAEQAKSGTLMSKASDEASQIRKMAQDILDKSQAKERELTGLRKQAEDAMAIARVESQKLLTDQQAFHNEVAIFERKRAALDAALKQ